MVTAAREAAALGHPNVPVHLSSALFRQFAQRRSTDDRTAVLRAASRAPDLVEAPELAAGLTAALGVAYGMVGRHEEAVARDGRAAELFRALGDRQREAAAPVSRSASPRSLDRFEEDGADLARAAELFAEIGDDWGTAMVRSNLGRRPPDAGARARGRPPDDKALRLPARCRRPPPRACVTGVVSGRT
ncbi:hypothetical protein [Streptomyces sp. SP18CS02]|uniref:hypothetical protein n=1 Tax=Streptomyces sp. SP18CS02 TaxID=3002531 RepID=UPI002E7A0E1B|nr:hypothetical protein [Streptomyces sp. SP18CS02]MEE1752845.1 hypothetical protein [Streptomyces sp. SP18CS02]